MERSLALWHLGVWRGERPRWEFREANLAFRAGEGGRSVALWRLGGERGERPRWGNREANLAFGAREGGTQPYLQPFRL